MGVLTYIEAKLIDSCNFSCRACIPFSNIATEGTYHIEEFERDIVRLADIYENIEVFRLLGGEPLLLDNICEYVKVVRKHFSNSRICIVSNGTLIGKLAKEQLDCFRETQTQFFISIYPNKYTTGIVDNNISYLKNNGIDVNFYEAEYFCVNHCFSERKLSKYELQEIYDSCRRVVDCTNIYKGKIYACPKPFSYKHLNKRYGTEYCFEEDGIDIHSPYTDEKAINDYLKHYMKSCSLCTISRGFIKWDNNSSIDITEWENTERNNMLITSDSSEELIDEITNKDIMCVYRNKDAFAWKRVKASVNELKKIYRAALVVSDYSINEFELFQIAVKKAGLLIDSIYCDDDIYEKIAHIKGKQYKELFEESEGISDCYLILCKSFYEACKISNRIINNFNIKSKVKTRGNRCD